ncbi:MAG: hypothetical protein ACUZ8O_13470 [Candidatus Anammoxibacter sp.]
MTTLVTAMRRPNTERGIPMVFFISDKGPQPMIQGESGAVSSVASTIICLIKPRVTI